MLSTKKGSNMILKKHESQVMDNGNTKQEMEIK